MRADFFDAKRHHHGDLRRVRGPSGPPVPSGCAKQPQSIALVEAGGGWPAAALNLERALDLVRGALAAADEHLRSARSGYEVLSSMAELVTLQPLETHQRLSDRERRVALLAASGLGDRQIAEALCVSVNTVKTQMKSVLAKLGLRSRWQLRDVMSPEGRSSASLGLLSPGEGFHG